MPTPFELELLKRRQQLEAAAEFVGPREPEITIGPSRTLDSAARQQLERFKTGSFFGWSPAYNRMSPEDRAFNESLWVGGRPVTRTLTNPDGSWGDRRVIDYTPAEQLNDPSHMRNRPNARTTDIVLPKEHKARR
jgi:hypothetical protein